MTRRKLNKRNWGSRVDGPLVIGLVVQKIQEKSEYVISKENSVSQKRLIHQTVESKEQRNLLYKDNHRFNKRKSRIYDAIQTHKYKSKLTQST